MPDGGFGLAHLLYWLARGDGARIEDISGAGAPFGAVTMSGLPDGSPPMRPGGLFLAIKGEQRDGHDFVDQALRNGAAAALVSRVPPQLREEAAAGRLIVLQGRSGDGRPPRAGGSPVLVLVDDPQTTIQRCAAWWRRQQPARVVAITGSVGKTTTKDLLANVLGRRFAVLKTEGNLNNELGLPIMALRLTRAHQVAVLEVGISAVGEMVTFAAIAQPDASVVTRVAPAHLHLLKDVDTVAHEKGILVEALGPGGVALLNADDPRVARMASRTAARTVLFGQDQQAEVRATDVRSLGFEGLRFRLHRHGRSADISTPLVGTHFVTALLAAAAAAFECGADWPDVVAGLAQPLEGQRLLPRHLPDGTTILDDTYNASPEAMKVTLDVLAETPGRRIAVLGDMFELGAYAEAGHQEVGAYVPGRAEELLAVGELAPVVAGAARAAGLAADRAAAVRTNEDAIAYLKARLRAGDCVLVKGSRGMRMEQIVAALTGDPSAGAHH